jgi:signal transduction histidine kinase
MILLVGLLVSFVLFRMTRAQVGARAKAEESEAARSRFFATMSHELRTPINAIMGYNDLLLGGIYGELPKPQAHSIGRAQKAARHLAELVNDVLDLSKIEAGKVRLDIEAVDVAEIIDDLSSTFGPMAESRGCVLDLTHSDCKQTIWTDPRRVRQILLNLLSNAAKFGAGKPIKLCCVATGDGVAIEVTDRGNGISPADLNRIFDEFVQLEKGDPEGTGLGLAISRRLAVLLGGALEVDSTLNQGSTFRLKLPARSSRRMAVH